MVDCGLLLACLVVSVPPDDAGPPNLSLGARAAASESQDDLTPEKAIDGDPATRWSGIPGHNSGVWYRIDFPRPARIAEVLIRQHDRYVCELDLQVPDGAGGWRTVRHLGKPGRRLPKVLFSRIEPVEEAASLRIGNITNGPSFTEVEVRGEASPPAVRIASDLDGRFLGIVTDRWGAEPVPGASVALSGEAAGGPWRSEAASGEDGLFVAPMPLGLRGTVRAEVRPPGSAGAPVAEEFQAIDFRPGLTPRGRDAATADLGGRWLFAPDPPERVRSGRYPPEGFWEPGFDDGGWGSIAVPAHWEMEGFRPATSVGGYRIRFRAPPGVGRLKIRFEGVYSRAEVWVNGRAAARHEGGFTPFEADISDLLRDGENLLALRVTGRTRTSEELDKASQYADFPLGGIIRPVTLFRVPPVHLAALRIETVFDAAYRDATVRGRAVVANESGEPWKGSLLLRLAGPGGKPVAPDPSSPMKGEERYPASPIEVPAWGRTEVPISIPVASPDKWDAEHPVLYVLTARLESGGRLEQEVEEKIGFRQTEVRGNRLLLNGRPVKVRGTCHHDSHIALGRAVTADLTRRDLVLMKEANLNAVRTSHYPPHPELPRAADAIGLYVEDEAPFCWVAVSDDLTFAPHVIELTAELIERDRNRPSVFMWSLCNESGFGGCFERSHAWARRADPGRPTAAATSAWLEIATLHNPLAISRIDENEKLDRPLTFDESLAPFQGIFADVGELWVDPGIRDYYAEPLPAIFDRFMTSETTFGSMIWCWADDIFQVPGRGLEYGRGATGCHFLEDAYLRPGRGLVGDAPWGLVDGWRRPKPEFWIAKKLHSPVKVPEGALPLPAEGSTLRVPVENRFDFTDLSEIEVRWSLGDRSGAARASVPPRSRGEIAIDLPDRPAAGEVLLIEFVRPGGGMIDAYRLHVGEERAAAPAAKGPEAAPLAILDEESLAGPAVRIAGKEFEVAFDRTTGQMRRCVGFGRPLLLEFPAVHILPTRRPLSPLPDRSSWKLAGLDVRREGEDVLVEVKGSYRDLDGAYRFAVTPRGEIRAKAAFAYSGEELLAREVGLRTSLPRDCDLLQWDRKAEWSVYPEDHIGRPRGEARAFAALGGTPAGMEPDRPWSADPSPMGTNDFRSTKRQVRWAVLRAPEGPGILVDSGGPLHVRAMAETDRISLHANSWYGGTGAGWWEWTHNYGQGRKIAKGETIEAEAVFRIVR
jgi:beta-galactosidase